MTSATTPFFRTIEENGDRTAIICGQSGQTWRYAELAAAEELLRPWLPDPKGLIALFADRSPAGVAAYLALLRSGHALLLLPTGLDEERKQTLIQLYRPETVVSVNEPHPHDSIAGNLDFFGGRLQISGPRPCSGAIHPDLALLLSTSGSTGSPKCVRLSTANLNANAASIADYLGLDADERPLTTLPLAYSYGLSVINSHLAVGASIVASEVSLLSPSFWQQCNGHRITSLAGVPFSWEMLLKTGLAEKAPSSLRHLTQAGGRLADDAKNKLLDLAEARKWRFWVMYGQTEATARMAYVPSHRLREKISAAGIAIPGGNFDILGPKDGTGEVIYRGANVMMGYAHGRDCLIRGDEQAGVLHTGDLGHLDDEGFLFITGRLSRMVKLYGKRIGLDELENWLEATTGACIACLGSDSGIAVFGENVDAEEIIRLLTQRLGLPRWMVRCSAIAGIPRTLAGKKDYAALSSGPR